jgi:N utilization substance protein A
VRLTTDQIRLMAVFESITGVLAKDCIFNNKNAVFIVDEKNMGKAIGRGGQNIKRLQQITGRKVEIIGFSEEPQKFLKNIFHPAHILAVNVQEKNGRKIAQIHMDRESRRIFERKIDSRLRLARELAKRYFDIDNVVVM